MDAGRQEMEKGILALFIATMFLIAATIICGAALAAPGQEPLLVRAARGEAVERTPVWMMRQAGRHMAAYREICRSQRNFRLRSETPRTSTEISLQPWRAYGVDGVIVFSDILTPLPAMGVDFDVSEEGQICIQPVRTREDFELRMTGTFSPAMSLPFVGETLSMLRRELEGSGVALLGFVGLPYTLCTYLIEGQTGTMTDFAQTRKLRVSDPKLLHDMLDLLSRNIVDYAVYQIDSGAQVMQVFDSWAGHLNSDEFASWAAPYQRRVVQAIRKQRPGVPVIVYMAPGRYSRELLEMLASCGADVVSVDHTIDIEDARKRLCKCGYPHICLQGNLDPSVLRDGTAEEIKQKTADILKAAGARGHIMNLGHGIDSKTPEENASLFVECVKSFRHGAAPPREKE